MFAAYLLLKCSVAVIHVKKVKAKGDNKKKIETSLDNNNLHTIPQQQQYKKEIALNNNDNYDINIIPELHSIIYSQLFRYKHQIHNITNGGHIFKAIASSVSYSTIQLLNIIYIHIIIILITN